MTLIPEERATLPVRAPLFCSHADLCSQEATDHTATHTYTGTYCSPRPEGGKGRVTMAFIIRENHTQLMVSGMPFVEELVFYYMAFIKYLLCAKYVVGYAFRDKQHFVLCFQIAWSSRAKKTIITQINMQKCRLP